MKVLYISNYRSGTEWGRIAQQYILALDAVGINIVPRNLPIAGVDGVVSPRLETLEKRDTIGCDVVIQHTIPTLMEHNAGFKRCIGMFGYETSHFRRSGWASYLNLMDEVWVPNNQMIDTCKASHVTVPVSVVHPPCDLQLYTQRYQPYPISELKNCFNFYVLGELSRRRNLVAALKAFHIEFNPKEPVNLLIKVTVPGQPPQESFKHTSAIIEDVKRELKLYDIKQYKNEILIMQDVTLEEQCRIHATCDCCLSPSFGESWDMTSFDAMAFGKTPICTDVGGMHDALTTLLGDKAGWLVPGTPTAVFGMSQSSMPGMYCGDEEWVDIEIGGLRKAMREAVEDTKLRQQKAELGAERAYDFSHEAIGQRLKVLLEQYE